MRSRPSRWLTVLLGRLAFAAIASTLPDLGEKLGAMGSITSG